MLVRTFLGGEAAPLPLISRPARSIPCSESGLMNLAEAANRMSCQRSSHVLAVLQISRDYFGLPGQGRQRSPRRLEI
jgi:hypothetical protein